MTHGAKGSCFRRPHTCEALLHQTTVLKTFVCNLVEHLHAQLGDLASAINLHQTPLQEVQFGIALDCRAGHTRDCCDGLERRWSAFLENLQHLNLSIGKTERLDAKNLTKLEPLLFEEGCGVVGLAVNLNLFCAFNCAASIAASGACDIFEYAVLEVNVLQTTLDDLTQLIRFVRLEVEDSQTILERWEQLVKFGSRKDHRNLCEVKLKSIFAPIKFLKRSALSVEDGEKCHHQIFGKCVTLIKEKSYFVTLHNRQEDLLEEHLIVLDCGAIEFQHGARLAVHVGKRLGELLQKLSLAQTLCTIEQEKGHD